MHQPSAESISFGTCCRPKSGANETWRRGKTEKWGIWGENTPVIFRNLGVFSAHLPSRSDSCPAGRAVRARSVHRGRRKPSTEGGGADPIVRRWCGGGADKRWCSGSMLRLLSQARRSAGGGLHEVGTEATTQTIFAIAIVLFQLQQGLRVGSVSRGDSRFLPCTHGGIGFGAELLEPF